MRAPSILHPAEARRVREDAVPVGSTRPARFLGLPFPLAVVMGALAYLIQTNVTGWRGLGWAVAVVAPFWFVAVLAIARDPYGANVFLAWFRCCALLRDPLRLGAPSLSPLPGNRAAPERRTPRVR
ncbi:VirB3 family type IV secretion system protein [Muricoccus pecuniae]|uniref:Type IV secretory pathway VirB3-like protein n=1 Tax=Muricoccus pecuniae TaxID=693023 RepID=A0A840YBH1_9PROT|nr:VirB3 family type IV secretion system protein [Roseomonas pecuniae]MBB5696059.1 type IV secretory pathway VirB3-like protein [Roseomonas pecuniae]